MLIEREGIRGRAKEHARMMVWMDLISVVVHHIYVSKTSVIYNIGRYGDVGMVIE